MFIGDQSRKPNGNPFEGEPLPKAFYYPSQPKDLKKRERKTCLSPERKEEDQTLSPADKQFLHQTNTIHEIPTRENGITADESSSTQFNESWPSTEQPTTIASTPETVADSTIETIKSSEVQGWRDLTQISLPDSTLARYIYRFRHSAPSSRQARDRAYFDMGKEGEFWWLSSPDSLSTPRQSTPLEEHAPSSKSSLSPKMKKKPLRKKGLSPTLTPLSKVSSGPSALTSSIDGMDTPTKRLQKKAKELIDKSESTLDSTSDSFQQLEKETRPKIDKDHVRSKLRAEKDADKNAILNPTRHYNAPPLHPDDDILYQWRLARKMEKAQQREAEGVGVTRHLSKLKSSSQITTTLPHRAMSYQPIAVENKTRASVVAESATTGVHLVTCLTPTGWNGTKSVVVPTLSHSPVVSSTVRVPSSEHSGEHLNLNVNTVPSAHKDLPQSNELETKGNFSANGLASSCPTTSAALLTSSTITTAVLADPVSHVGSFELTGLKQLAHHHHLPNQQYSTGNVPPHMHLSCDILSCPHDMRGSHQTMQLPVVTSVHGHRETGLPKEKGVNTEQNKDSTAVKSKHGRISDRNENKKTKSKKNHRQDMQLGSSTSEKSDDVQKAVKNEYTTVELRDFQQRENRSGESRKPRTKVVGNIIGQVVSERLFPSPDSTHHETRSSTSTISTEDYGSVPETSDDSFSDDEIIHLLKEKMRRYRKELWEIDMLLNDQTTR